MGAPIGGFEQSPSRCLDGLPGTYFPRRYPRCPKSRINGLGVARFEGQIDRARILVAVEDPLPAIPPVEAAKHSALGVRAVGVAQHCGEDAIGVRRVHHERRDLLAVLKPQVPPGLAAVCGLVDSVAHRQVGSLQTLAASYVDGARVGGGDCDRAHRTGRLAVEDRRPNLSVVRASPHSTVHRRHVEHVGGAGRTGDGHGSPSAKGPDASPFHFREPVDVPALSRGWIRCESEE